MNWCSTLRPLSEARGLRRADSTGPRSPGARGAARGACPPLTQGLRLSPHEQHPLPGPLGVAGPPAIQAGRVLAGPGTAAGVELSLPGRPLGWYLYPPP